jgi:hypothetical protein
MGAKDRCANFCDEFLGGERMGAEPLSHVAINAMRGAGRMDLMPISA